MLKLSEHVCSCQTAGAVNRAPEQAKFERHQALQRLARNAILLPLRNKVPIGILALVDSHQTLDAHIFYFYLLEAGPTLLKNTLRTEQLDLI